MADASPAIGGLCQDADNPSVEALVGSAFAVSATAALTAFHCVGDRESKTVRHSRVSIWFHDRFIPAEVVEPIPELDVAVLELEKDLPDDLAPLKIVNDARVQAPFTSIGWPLERPFSPHYFAVSGHIVDVNGRIFEGAPALQLHCVQSATLSLHGYSGAPVLINGIDRAAVGLIRWNPERLEAPDFAIGGTIYATPISAVLSQSTYLQSLDQGQLEITIDGEPEDGYCISHSNADLDVARWIGTVLRREGIGARVRGEYVVPGTNYLPSLRDAHQKYPNVLLILSPSTLKCDSPSHQTEIDWMANGEIAGEIIPVRVDPGKIPNFIYDIEPIDLRGCGTEDEVSEALIEGLAAATRRPKLPAPRFPERLIHKKPTTLSRSRLPQVTLRNSQRIEGGA
ncbi:trypsin-like peptidase domain-containing protein [Micromonospora sp. CV4]|uniref:trypsin-like peptidase domain-containing protein n=1 Tax=Micromonospora sp. CV4 TaxID=2478711 RepID=UPI000EF4A35F|nr:trypsin-like peptidase domain-containing protein [Micromonospora sp. CV4]RLP93474.1 TIR domain-containing protein [Micromonospora sp. CV4]